MVLASGWRMVAQGKPLEKVSWELAAPGVDEVVVKIAGCGVCHTDLSYLFDGVPLKSALPRVLGHEISGVVESAGKNFESLVGKQVIVPAVLPCGDCDPCKRGRTAICAQQIFPGNDIDGGFATHVTVPGRGLCRVPEDTHSELSHLAVVADAVTTPFNAVRSSDLSENQVAVVVGVGGIGAFAVQIAAAQGAHVIALDIEDERLELAAQHGADLSFNTRNVSAKELKKKIRSAVKERGWPVSEWVLFECSGTSAGQDLAFNLLNYGATLMVVGYSAQPVSLRLSNLMAFDARAIGIWGCPPELYPQAVELVTQGKINLEPFLEQRSMQDINEILADIHGGRLRKRVVLIP